MSTEPEEEISDEALAEQEKAMKALLSKEPAEPPPDLLPSVQGKLRRRSKGKFYADGWSTSQSRVSYVLVAFVMLVVLGVAYVALGPTGVTR